MLFLLSQQAVAQVYSFKSFGLEKGVFPSRIECIDQASSGELLIGTLAGLVMYDGQTFRTLGVGDGLAESSISSLYSEDDVVWLGHWTGSISRFDLNADTFEVFDLAEDLNYSSVLQIIRISESELLILSADGKVYSLKDKQLTRLAIPLLGEGGKVVELVINEDLYLISDQSVIEADRSDLEKMNVLVDHSFREVQDALLLNEGIWLFGTSNGLEAVSANQVEWLDILKSATKDMSIVQMTRVDNELWLATEKQGVVYFNLETQDYKQIRKQNGLSYNLIQSIFVDREKNVWIGTTAALDQFLGKAFTLNDVRTGLEGNLVWDVEQIGDQVLAITNAGLAISKSSGRWGELEIEMFVEAPGAEPRRLLSDGVTDVFMLDRDGIVWKTSTVDWRFEQLHFGDYKARCFELVNGELWIGTERGIIVLEGGRATEQLTKETGLAGDRINGIYYSRVRNETWITSIGSPTTRFHEGKFQLFGPDRGVTSTVIQDAAFDDEGNVWFASYDEGVFYLENDTFYSLNDISEQAAITTFAIDIDAEGVVWVGHNWGIDAIDPKKKELRFLGEEDGFLGIEVNPNALIATEDQGLWLGTLMGVLNFDKTRLSSNTLPPLLDVNQAFLGSINLLNSDEAVGVFSENNDLSITFSAVGLNKPTQNRYRYRLLGIHTNWKEQSELTPINYYALPTGDYTFEIEACNGDGVCSTAPLRYSFTVAPPYYRTWWFYTLLFIGSLFVIFFMDRYRVVRLLEEKNRVEEVLEHREQQMIEANQTISALRSSMAQQSHVVSFFDTEQQFKNAIAPSELLPNYSVYSQQIEEVGSHAAYAIQNQSFSAVIFMDVGLVGPAAYALKRYLSNVIQNLSKTLNSKEQLLEGWTNGVNDLKDQLPKSSGVNWALLCLNNEAFDLYNQGFKVYELIQDGGSGCEAIEGVNAWQSISQTASIMIHSGRLFEQLDETGTKRYSIDQLKLSCGRSVRETPERIAHLLHLDLEEWRGTMDQFGDEVFYFWNHA